MKEVLFGIVVLGAVLVYCLTAGEKVIQEQPAKRAAEAKKWAEENEVQRAKKQKTADERRTAVRTFHDPQGVYQIDFPGRPAKAGVHGAMFWQKSGEAYQVVQDGVTYEVRYESLGSGAGSKGPATLQSVKKSIVDQLAAHGLVEHRLQFGRRVSGLELLGFRGRTPKQGWRARMAILDNRAYIAHVFGMPDHVDTDEADAFLASFAINGKYGDGRIAEDRDE